MHTILSQSYKKPQFNLLLFSLKQLLNFHSSLHEINTFRAEYLSQGMNHFEGGWPKDINPSENDQTMRFRKKIEKDDGYINSVLTLCTVIQLFNWSLFVN